MKDTGSWNHRKGMVRRLSRIFAPDGRGLIIAADHRQRGIQEGMENFGDFADRILSVIPYSDALVTTKEPLAHLITHHPAVTAGTGLLLSLNRTGLSGSSFELDDRPVVGPKTAVKWGLEGAKLLLRINPSREETNSQLSMCRNVCDECDRLDLPLIIEPLYCAPQGGSLKVDDSPQRIRYSAIIAADFGVPALKIPYPSGPDKKARQESFRDILGSVNSRVFVLGGRKSSLESFLAKVHEAIQAGASGLVIGRNVLLDDNPPLVACALRNIVHRDQDPKTALKGARSEVSG